MFVEPSASPQSTGGSQQQSPILPSSIAIPGGVFRSRSGSSPHSQGGSFSGSQSGSVTALSILSSSRGTPGSLLESDAFTERQNTEAIIEPSPVPFPESLRKLSMEVESRAAAKSFDLDSSPTLKPSSSSSSSSSSFRKGGPVATLSSSPDRMLNPASRTRNIQTGLTDSAEWDAVRQEAQMEVPFDMEV
mmetsp:Transcript_20216/g.26322  ORF Transcript_20216/g.26322 Transcript_20216/m.26322 type:complete len:190 (+) Transcript_20216:1-570(+)